MNLYSYLNYIKRLLTKSKKDMICLQPSLLEGSNYALIEKVRECHMNRALEGSSFQIVKRMKEGKK